MILRGFLEVYIQCIQFAYSCPPKKKKKKKILLTNQVLHILKANKKLLYFAVIYEIVNIFINLIIDLHV